MPSPLGKVSRNVTEGARVQTIFAQTSLCAQTSDHALFSLHKRKKFQKRSVQPCRLTAPTRGLPSKKNSDLTLRRNWRCKWGASEGLEVPPITDFSPPSAYGRIRTSSRALRPARTLFFCRDRRPRLSALCVGAERPHRLPTTSGGGECVQIILSQTPVCAQTPFPRLRERSDRQAPRGFGSE